MCFTLGVSLFVGALGVLYGGFSMWSLRKHRDDFYNPGAGTIVFYFGVMELLQVWQHLVKAESLDNPACDGFKNQFSTFLGMLHVCWQPHMLHRFRRPSLGAALAASTWCCRVWS